jgi:hypothetical protein
MDMDAIGARVRRAPWGLWLGGFLLALDAVLLPFWVAWLVAFASGGPGVMSLAGIVLPTWVWRLAAGR